MDNAQKAIMIGVGLFITIIIIAAVMLITGAGQDLMNQGMGELSNISDSLSRQLYADYADGEFSGSQVISAIKKYAGSDVKVYLNATESTDKNGGTTMTTNNNTTEFTATNMGSAASKITSTAKYKSSVQVTDNKVVAINFTKKN